MSLHLPILFAAGLLASCGSSLAATTPHLPGASSPAAALRP
ncbi:MAG TPA: hypothetical protein VGD81_15235 [Opitutaceae bacterium]